MRIEMIGRVMVLSLFALTLWLMFLIFKPFIPGLVWATVLAVAFQPLYSRLVRWFRGKRWTAAIVLSAMVAAFIVVPTVLAAVKVGQGVVQAYDWLEAQQDASGESLIDTIKGFPVVEKALDLVDDYVDLEEVNLREMALGSLQALGSVLTQKTKSLLTNALKSFITLAVMLVTMAVMFHEGERFVATVRRYLPLSEDDKEQAFAQLQSVTRAVFFGVMMTALVQAIAGAIGFAIVGLPQVITFGAAMFFCALLPAGPVLVWGPAAIYLFATGRWVQGLILTVWGIAVVGSIDNFLRPIFIGKGVRMHLLLVFFGILGGMMAFGLLGLFTGPLVITLFLFLLEVVRRDFFPADSQSEGEA